jgi:para-nitrobenzyl esterase
VDLERTMQGYWARHATTGDPNGGGAPSWPAYRRDADVRLNFNLDPTLITDFRREYCDFWGARYDNQFK